MLPDVKQDLPLKIIQKMYTSLVEPYFRYCCPVRRCVGTNTLHKLQKLQNRAATSNCFDAPSEPPIQELGWLTIEQLIEQETAKVVYKALHNETPLYVKGLLLKLSDAHSKVLCNFPPDFNVPCLRTSTGQKSFRYRGVRFRNGLRDATNGARTCLAIKIIFCKRRKQ